MKLSLALLLMSAAPALAGPAAAPAAEKDPAFEIAVDSAVYPPEAFRAHGFRAEAMPPEAESPFAPPAAEKRDAAFAKVEGLEEEIAEMDALDRDLLFIRARNYAPEKLRGLYPKVAAAKLTALQKALRP